MCIDHKRCNFEHFLPSVPPPDCGGHTVLWDSSIFLNNNSSGELGEEKGGGRKSGKGEFDQIYEKDDMMHDSHCDADKANFLLKLPDTGRKV